MANYLYNGVELPVTSFVFDRDSFLAGVAFGLLWEVRNDV